MPEFNPFTFYLEHLPPWNGDDYILAMSVSVSVKGGVEEQMLFAEYLKMAQLRYKTYVRK